MMKTTCVIVCLSILATICSSLPAYNTRMERQYWKGRFSRNLIPQGRFNRDSIPQYWKGRFSRRDEIPQYWKGRFSRDEIPFLDEAADYAAGNEDDKREIAAPMMAREVEQDLDNPFNDQYWKGRFMRLRNGHKRDYAHAMGNGQAKYGMRDVIAQHDEEREAAPVQEEEEEEKRQQNEEEEEEEEERDMKDEDMQGRFARQGRFKKNAEDLDELHAAEEKAVQGRF